MNTVLCSVPGEPLNYPYPRNVRSMGDLPILPKFGIVALVKWMEKNGYTSEDYDFYDIDMLLPTEGEVRAYFLRNMGECVELKI